MTAPKKGRAAPKGEERVKRKATTGAKEQKAAKTRPVGRPTKYDPAYCEKVVEWGRLGKSRTWIASEIDVTRETLTEWAKVNPEFSAALDRAKQFEQRWWEDAGQELMTQTGFSASAWAKNMSCRFPQDWREKQEVALSSPTGGPVETVTMSAAEYEARLRKVADEI